MAAVRLTICRPYARILAVSSSFLLIFSPTDDPLLTRARKGLSIRGMQPPRPAEEVATALRNVRERLGVTREQVETDCGVKAGTLRAWESGRNVPTLEGIAAVVDLYRQRDPSISIDALVFGESSGLPTGRAVVDETLLRTLENLRGEGDGASLRDRLVWEPGPLLVGYTIPKGASVGDVAAVEDRVRAASENFRRRAPALYRVWLASLERFAREGLAAAEKDDTT